MWGSIERNIDGVVGRMLSWLTHPPVHSLQDISDGVERLTETVSETVSDQVELAVEAGEKAAERGAETVEEVAEAVAETAEEVTEAVAEKVEEVAEGVAEKAEAVADKAEAVAEGQPTRAPDKTDKKLLAELDASDGGVSMKDLKTATGGKPYALRQRLARLIAEGRVERRGKGMRTRYHLTEK